MPMHDWTRVSAGTYHDFHQDWVIEIRRALNGGLLPKGYSAFTDQKPDGPEPDLITLERRDPPPAEGGLAVADAPPQAARVRTTESEETGYARRGNRLWVRDPRGRRVAVLEVVSPGNKDSRHAVRSFLTKAVDFLRSGIHLVVIDPFPPTPRDPDGVHELIWHELTGDPPAPAQPEKPLFVTGYDAGEPLTEYATAFAVGDALPDVPLFFAPRRYVTIPLEQTYLRSWAAAPEMTRDAFAPPA